MRNVRLLFFSILLALQVVGSSRFGHAEEAALEQEKPLEERFHDLDQKVRILERKQELERESAAEKAKDAPAVKSVKDGFSLRSADNSFSLKIGGYVQADGRFFLHDDQGVATNTFLLRRVRPVLEGTVYKYYDFRIMTDFGGGAASVQDAYLDIAYWPKIKLRAGKFKPPVGLERLQSGASLLFVERALPTSLVPNRDVGLQFHGDLGEGIFGYALGAFNGVADGGSGDGDANDNKTFAGRIFVHPFKATGVEPLQGLGLGVSGSHGNEHGTAAAPGLPSFRSSGQLAFFSYRTAVAAVPASGATPASPTVPPVVSDGRLFRISPQGYYYWGPFGLLGEYVTSSQDVTLNAPAGIQSTTLKNSAAQVAVSYVLTGGAASFKGVSPKQSFDPSKGEWGEIELKARVHRLKVDQDAFPVYANPVSSAQKATAWGSIGT
jgi:phosphate-selective porin OprO/OprP